MSNATRAVWVRCVAVLLLLCSAPLSRTVAQANPTASAHALPDASLYKLRSAWTAHDGRTLSLSSFRGETVVLAMVYTSCTMTCPLITSEMQAVQRGLPVDVRARVRFVLASFDPARDSLAALRAHVAKMALDNRWTFVRATPADVRQLAVLVGVSYRQLPTGDFDHSNIISVLDADGVLRFQSPRIPTDRPALVAAVSDAARRKRD